MSLNPALQLPVENEFIPTDFAIRERPQDVSKFLTVVAGSIFILFVFLFECVSVALL